MRKLLLSVLLMFSCASFAATTKIILAGTTWCPACKFAKPQLIQFAEKNKNVEIEIVNLDKLNKEQLRDFLAKHKMGNYIPEYFFLVNDKKTVQVTGGLSVKDLNCFLDKIAKNNFGTVEGKFCGINERFVKFY